MPSRGFSRGLALNSPLAYARCDSVQEGEWQRADALQRYLEEKDAA